MEQLLLKQNTKTKKITNIRKIGVISDTHGAAVPEKVFDIFKEVDLILHAGDIKDLSSVPKLEKIAPVIAVYGNMDNDEIREKLPKKIIIKINNFKIGLTHGDGPPDGLVNYTKGQFNEKLDCIVYGHSHTPFNEIINGTLFFNSGSATDKVFTDINSIGILTINDKIKGKIIKL